MSEQPTRIDSVTDADSGETVGIAPVDASSLPPMKDESDMSDTAFECLTASVLAIILVVITIGLKRYLF